MGEELNRDRGGADRRSLTPEQFLQKLTSALGSNGDFPASAKIVTELRMLTSEPSTTASQVAEVILKDPSLGVRVLHLVNSSYYKRAKPISTITQAIVQVGMKPLAEMCSGLILLQKFVPEARQNGAFAACLRKSIVTSLLARSLATQLLGSPSKTLATRNAESGYLAGTMAEMGTLLTAFYFPQVYDNALKRSEAKKQDLASSIKQIVGFSPSQLSAEVIQALNLPQYYSDVVTKSQEIIDQPSTTITSRNADLHELAKCLSAASAVSDAISTKSDPQALVEAIQQICAQTKIDPQALQSALQELNAGIAEHCATLELKLPAAPEFLDQIALGIGISTEKNTEVEAQPAPPKVVARGEQQEDLKASIREIEAAISRNEPTTNVLTSVMEAFAYCLKFDRVLLMLANRNRTAMEGRMMLGIAPGIDPTKISKPIGNGANADTPENIAFINSRIILSGEPVLSDGLPIAVIPVGIGKRAVGVVYADRTVKPPLPLNPQEREALIVLCELIDKSLSNVSKTGR